MEFTVERNKLFMLQTRNGKRTAGFPSDEVPDLFAEVKWNQRDKENCISE